MVLKYFHSKIIKPEIYFKKPCSEGIGQWIIVKSNLAPDFKVSPNFITFN